jgi:hypothetical protein
MIRPRVGRVVFTPECPNGYMEHAGCHQLNVFYCKITREVPTRLQNNERSGNPARWPMYVFLAGACVCLSFSAICHTLACVGARVSSIVWWGGTSCESSA